MGKIRTQVDKHASFVPSWWLLTTRISIIGFFRLPQAGKLYAPPGKLQLIYFVDDLNMPALDKYNTQQLGFNENC